MIYSVYIYDLFVPVKIGWPTNIFLIAHVKRFIFHRPYIQLSHFVFFSQCTHTHAHNHILCQTVKQREARIRTLSSDGLFYLSRTSNAREATAIKNRIN